MFSMQTSAVRGAVRVVRAHGIPDVVGVEHSAAVVGNGVVRDAAEHRGPRRLGSEYVRLVSENYLVAALRVGQDGHEVAHSPACHKDGGLLAQPLRCHRLQRVDLGSSPYTSSPSSASYIALRISAEGWVTCVASKIDQSHVTTPVVRW